MRHRAVSYVAAVFVVLLIIWRISEKSVSVQKKFSNIYGFYDIDQIKAKLQMKVTPGPKCNLSRVCPSDHFAFHISSGTADVIGPKMCFDGKIIMSHVLNNVGPGMNIVVINGENGLVEMVNYLNKENAEGMLAYLKEIKPGRIVLVASFDDVTTKVTKEMREMLEGMGSALIKAVKRRDSWAFAARVGTGNKSVFEKRAVNDQKTNIYEGWPASVVVGGCIPKTPSDGQKPSNVAVMKTRA